MIYDVSTIASLCLQLHVSNLLYYLYHGCIIIISLPILTKMYLYTFGYKCVSNRLCIVL
jgi:hypothetical protein